MSPELRRQLRTIGRELGRDNVPYSEALAAFREAWAEGLIIGHGGNQSSAARAGGIHRNTVARMVNPRAPPPKPYAQSWRRSPTRAGWRRWRSWELRWPNSAPSWALLRRSPTYGMRPITSPGPDTRGPTTSMAP